MYHNFLIVLAQINRSKRAKVIFEDIEIVIEESQNKKYWILSTVIYKNSEKIPMSVQQCVFSCGVLQWQDFGPYLKMDTENNAAKLMHQVKIPEGFISFKNLIINFVKIAKEWKETLLELSGNEPLLLSKNF